MEIHLNTPLFFTKDDDLCDLFLEIISEQHGECCRKKFNSEYISSCFYEFTHGFVIFGESNKEDIGFTGHQFLLKAFVLFEYSREKVGLEGNIEGFIRGKVICCNKKSRGLGKNLLDQVKLFAINRNVKRWIIHSLAYNDLIAYYRRYGFSQDKVQSFTDGGLKTVLMKIYFGNDIDLYNYSLDDGTCFEDSDLYENSIPNDDERENIFTSLYGPGF